MEPLTIEGVLQLFAESDRSFEQRLEKQRQEFQDQLEQRRIEAEKILANAANFKPKVWNLAA